MSLSPIMRGILEGLGSGLSVFSAQQQKQQEDARKAKQDAAKQAAEDASRRSFEQWKMDNAPPTEKQIEGTDAQGNRVKITQEWQRPSDPALGPPTQGNWKQIASQTIPRKTDLRTYQSGTDQVTDLVDAETGDTIKNLGRGPKFDPQAQEIAAARLELAQANAGKEKLGQIEQLTDVNGNAKFVRIGPDNVAHPITLEDGKTPATKQDWRIRGGENPNAPKPQPSAMLGADNEIIPILRGNAISPDAPDSSNKTLPPTIDQIPQGQGPVAPKFVDPSQGKPLGQFSGATSGSSRAQQLQAQAAAAIQAGADPKAVQARLQQLLSQ